MREVGLVDETRSGWQLIKENVMQLPLTLELEEGEVLDNSSPKSVSIWGRREGDHIAEKETDDVHLSRNNSDSLITTTLSIKDVDSSLVVISNNAEKRKYSDFDLNLEEFKKHGIARNKRTEALALMNHVNPDYIRAHLKSLGKKDTKGLAIMRMEQGEDPPKTLLINLTDEERCRKYEEWERA
jgi:hypothetical protein